MSYQDGLIYTITSGDDFYVGSTKDFTDRWRKHKSNMANKNSHEYNKKLYQVIRENKNDWNMTIHHEYPCETEEELKKEEQKTMDELKPTLNVWRAYTSEEQRKERDKQYSLDNKEHKAEYHKQRYQNNKVKIKEQTAQYRLDNKDKINEWHKQHRLNNRDKISQQITCECGAIIRRDSLARHKKSKKHLNYCPVILTQ